MAAKDPTFDELLERVRQLPPMDEEERIEQSISFAFGNVNMDRWEKGQKEIPIETFAVAAWKKEWRKAHDEIQRLKQALTDETATVNALAELLWQKS